jgi:hypothetical protein
MMETVPTYIPDLDLTTDSNISIDASCVIGNITTTVNQTSGKNCTLRNITFNPGSVSDFTGGTGTNWKLSEANGVTVDTDFTIASPASITTPSTEIFRVGQSTDKRIKRQTFLRTTAASNSDEVIVCLGDQYDSGPRVHNSPTYRWMYIVELVGVAASNWTRSTFHIVQQNSGMKIVNISSYASSSASLSPATFYTSGNDGCFARVTPTTTNEGLTHWRVDVQFFYWVNDLNTTDTLRLDTSFPGI